MTQHNEKKGRAVTDGLRASGSSATILDARPRLRRYQYVWSTVCAVDSLTPGRGAAVLLPDDVQAALFLLPSGELYAVGNMDPYGQAAVMSRGLTGDRGGEPTVASPLLKQVFSLIDGRCLDDASRRLPVFEVRVINGNVEIGMLRSRHRDSVAA